MDATPRSCLRTTLLLLLSAAALALGAAFGVRLGHPFAGVVAGYLVYLAVAARAFRETMPGADEAIFPTPELPRQTRR